MWAQQAAANASFPTAGAVLVIAGTVFALGYRLAVMHRANADYKTTKAAVPKLRKAFWTSVWAAVKFGFWVSLAGLVLIAWVVHDIRAQG